MAKKKNSKALDLILLLSVLLGLYFVYVLFGVLQDVRLNDIQGAPSTFAAVPSGLLAFYVFIITKDSFRKYVSLVVLTVLVFGNLVWFFGATSAGQYFEPKREVNVNLETGQVCPDKLMLEGKPSSCDTQ